jgi:hypothetical protein
MFQDLLFVPSSGRQIVSPETLVFNLNQMLGYYPKEDNLNMGHLFLSAFFLTPSNCHTPANNHAIPLLSFLEHHSTCNFLHLKN